MFPEKAESLPALQELHAGTKGNALQEILLSARMSEGVPTGSENSTLLLRRLSITGATWREDMWNRR